MKDLAVGLLGLVGIVGPGWWWARRHRLPAPPLCGLLLGALAMVSLVFGLELSGLPLNRRTVGIGWALGLLGLGLICRRTPEPPLAPRPAVKPAIWADWPFWLIATPTILAVFWRATAHPLFGIDTDFRWGFLAEQMWSRQSLEFYPPVAASDFTVYAWPDGIPPLVSSLYFALYLLAGGVKPAVTGPLVAVQFIVLLAGVAALAREWFSRRAAAWAVALLGVTPLAAWACAMGQETGFTALGLVGLLLYLPRDRAAESVPRLLAAGASAAVLALAREYGWVLVAFGFALACQRRLSGRSLLLLAGIAMLAAGPWYVRNALRTGNPLYNLSVGGWFPVNDAHARLMALYHESFTLSDLVRHGLPRMGIGMIAVLTFGCMGSATFFRQTKALLAAITLVIALWLASVPYTAAGFTYASRVLSPALAIGAVLGGAWLSSHAASRRHTIVALAALATLSLHSAACTLVLPDRLERRPIRDWLGVDEGLATYQRQLASTLSRIAARVGSARILALGGNNSFQRLGVDSVPPWSPDAAVIFDPRLAPSIVWRQLRASNIRYVLISRGDLNRRYLEMSPAFAAAGPNELRGIFADPDFVLFEIVSPVSETRP